MIEKNNRTEKFFILLYRHPNGKLEKFPNQDDTHYDIHELVAKLNSLDTIKGEFMVKRIEYAEVSREELLAFIEGANELRVTLH